MMIFVGRVREMDPSKKPRTRAYFSEGVLKNAIEK
jgi:hypothetical protein